MSENDRDIKDGQVDIHSYERIAWPSTSSMNVSVAQVGEVILGNRVTL
jgi:hypothetical protein